MSVRIRDQAELLQLVVRDAPVPRMAQRVAPICRERAMAAPCDRIMRHAFPTPGVVAVAAVGDIGPSPPAVLLGVSAKFTGNHARYYTNGPAPPP